MPIKILMPALSPTMREGNLARWLKKEGDKVNPGEVIAEIETDKATMEVESVDEGILAKIIIPQNSQNVPVNSLIAVLSEEGEDKADIDSFIAQNNSVSLSLKTDATLKKSNDSITNVEGIKHDSNKIFASPLAKRLAKIGDIRLENVQGSGPHGRIVKQDILSYDSSTSSNKIVYRDTEEYRSVPNNNIRKIIAKRLLESKQTVPHFYLSIECNVDKLLDVREDINKSFSEDKVTKISVNDFIILAVAKALQEVPNANASWSEDAIRYYNNVDISVAVAIENGIVTPIVKDANKKNIIELSREMKTLIKKAKDNKLTPIEFQGGGFTISNLGMYGIKNFNAIINTPQSCIMGVGASTKRAIVKNDQIIIATIMDVTLSADHRVIDGAVSAEFLASFKRFIENPVLMLI
ncbi:pyruvate dehydrogenase complex dihydrolipoamide acetyltransferase [Rickettsia prowazekii]|uniref:Dihydrolipoyllysine-residue acetyltransferase component of pyruvate dehydrogenase complex n=2 Tax=Rickettsia prowazekii TaxID=782 RepID=ODP2_RICPR|nr:pyruvate dehydrogenase complex dihydrolipoamide acetyltransferase [Rickettsia prowazekii]Q9ZD20.1 RecName: Full=Dihydrolipoyllysine-residue acetyltransferase component of pyruvate dehydrogenase complex; AltName: Full=Dihydrolipoamide acetyltransferase component of pyruvate dehydrogenase complex; AltName: Full=E2 [Rickettsia prowazekii str. Madrid E]ADE30058.1 Pyruvate dehydrogenase complex dihydrolipoamide acetyltransferase [Rickettsia prowazekii str. Rp22]AFE49333.1 branched-chain alpha-keto